MNNFLSLFRNPLIKKFVDLEFTHTLAISSSFHERQDGRVDKIRGTKISISFQVTIISCTTWGNPLNLVFHLQNGVANRNLERSETISAKCLEYV